MRFNALGYLDWITIGKLDGQQPLNYPLGGKISTLMNYRQSYPLFISFSAIAASLLWARA
jgi:hypothetical protein